MGPMQRTATSRRVLQWQQEARSRRELLKAGRAPVVGSLSRAVGVPTVAGMAAITGLELTAKRRAAQQAASNIQYRRWGKD